MTDYQTYSVVATCDKVPVFGGDLVWILSRTPQMNPALYAQLVNYVTSLGFNVTDLVKTVQAGCPANY